MLFFSSLSLKAEHKEEYIVDSISILPSELSLAISANSFSVLFFHSFKKEGYSFNRLSKNLAPSSTFAAIGCLNARAIVKKMGLLATTESVVFSD